jgi:hypothetical protein
MFKITKPNENRNDCDRKKRSKKTITNFFSMCISFSRFVFEEKPHKNFDAVEFIFT